jgi:methylglutaconyl-CoA hydratase
MKLPVLGTDFSGTTVRVEALPHGVKRLVLSRPEVRNAFNATTISEFQWALDQLIAIPSVEDMRLLVLAGEGTHFCAGADIAYMREQAGRGLVDSMNDARELGQLFFSLARFPTPVVCVVQGAAIGGGLGLAACSDYVLAAENAIFATTEVRLGIVPALISPYVVRKLGPSRAAPLMLSGKRYSAADAVSLGLVHETAPAPTPENDALAGALVRVISEFLKAGPRAARRAKELVLKAAPLPDSTLFEFTAQSIAEARAGSEAAAGLQDFFDKTKPSWAVDFPRPVDLDEPAPHVLPATEDE